MTYDTQKVALCAAGTGAGVFDAEPDGAGGRRPHHHGGGQRQRPVAPGGETIFQVQLTNFECVKGMDVTVTGTAGVVFRSIASEDITLTRDDNYTLSANKIQLEDLNGKRR